MIRVWLLLLAVPVWLSAGCTTIDYYRQSVGGHLGLMAKRTDLSVLLADVGTDGALTKNLQTVLAIREFATTELGLPDNDSYRSYVDVGDDYVLWNVIATGEFSLSAKLWCYPFTGCVAYRGYFARDDARAFAEQLRNQGLDVFVGGVRAYSTLGWFEDPVLNTMLDQPFSYLASVIFHELAHQRIYIKDDTTFNESFAVAVEREGVKRWLLQHDDLANFERYRERLAYDRRFIHLVLETRETLVALYGEDLPDEHKRAAKAQILGRLRERYAGNSKWYGTAYGHWLGDDLNNAKLALIATYHEQIPAFERLLEQNEGSLGSFYEAVEALGELSTAERAKRMRALTAQP